MSCFCAGHQQNVCARYILYLEFSVGDTFCIFNSLLVIHFLFAFWVGDTFCIFAVSVYTFSVSVFYREYIHKIEVCGDDSKRTFKLQFGTKKYFSCFWVKSLSEGFVGWIQRRRNCSQSVAVGGSSPGVARLDNTQLRLGC